MRGAERITDLPNTERRALRNQFDSTLRTENSVTHSILSDKQRTLTLDLILRFGSKIKQLNGSDSSGVGYDTQAIAEVSVISSTVSTKHVIDA